jgi:hypothetical protein
MGCSSSNQSNAATTKIAPASTTYTFAGPDFGVVINNSNLYVLEMGMVVGKFGNISVGDSIQINIASLKSTVQRLFVDCDTDKSGTIEIDEFEMLLKSVIKQSGLKTEFTAANIRKIFNSLDVDKNGTIDVTEWCQWILRGLSSDGFINSNITMENDEDDLDEINKTLKEKIDSILDGFEIIISTGCYVEYSVNKEVRYVSKRVDRINWQNCGAVVVLNGAAGVAVSMQWIMSAAFQLSSSGSNGYQQIEWDETSMNNVEAKNTWVTRTDVNGSVASKCVSKEVPITSSIDTATVGIQCTACAIEHERDTIMCGLKSFKQAKVKDVSEKLFVPNLTAQKKTDDSKSFNAIMALN